MRKTILLVFALVIALSCKKNDHDDSVKLEIGSVWLSGGLAYCAAQIRLDNGETLIVKLEDTLFYRSGDKVSVKYREISINKDCSPGIDCEIIDIKKVE